MPRPRTATLAEDTSTGSVVAPARGTPYIETRLLFGTERPDGGPAVTDEQFMAFVDREVTPGFPDGLTVREGRGQGRDTNGTIEKERSYELILLYPAAAAASDRKIEEIRGDYPKEFAQEAVARADDRTRVDICGRAGPPGWGGDRSSRAGRRAGPLTSSASLPDALVPENYQS